MNFIAHGWFCELQPHLHLSKRYQWQLDIPCSSCEEKQKGENFQENHFQDVDKKKRDNFPIRNSAAARLGSTWNNQFSWNMHMIWLRPVQTWGKTQDYLILLQVRTHAEWLFFPGTSGTAEVHLQSGQFRNVPVVLVTPADTHSTDQSMPSGSLFCSTSPL